MPLKESLMSLRIHERATPTATHLVQRQSGFQLCNLTAWRDRLTAISRLIEAASKNGDE
jgi:hypothetical protein